jgi:hypothetical protein
MAARRPGAGRVDRAPLASKSYLFSEKDERLQHCRRCRQMWCTAGPARRPTTDRLLATAAKVPAFVVCCLLAGFSKVDIPCSTANSMRTINEKVHVNYTASCGQAFSRVAVSLLLFLRLVDNHHAAHSTDIVDRWLALSRRSVKRCRAEDSQRTPMRSPSPATNPRVSCSSRGSGTHLRCARCTYMVRAR